jgi:cytochrome P450
VQHSIPRVPGGWLFGNLSEFKRDRIGLLMRVAREYRDVARLRIGAFPAWVVSSPELAQGVLVEHAEAFHKGFGLAIFAKPFLGEGLLTSEGDFHRRQRRLLAPAFMHKRIARYAETFGSYAERSRQRLQLSQGREVDLAHEMMRLTFEVVGKTLFDADVSDDASAVGILVTDVMEQMMAQMLSRVPLPPSFPSVASRRMRRSVAELDRLVFRLIEERRKTQEDRGDVLSMLLLARDADDGSAMPDRQVRDEALTVLLAGHETTANALSWTFYLLGRHPEVRAALERELDRVLAGRVPTLADLPQLPLTLAVFKEAMRLYPPAYMVTRRAQRDVTLKYAVAGANAQLHVRRGELVVVNIVGMQQRGEYFREPARFMPERLSLQEPGWFAKEAYLPFGGGPRVCIGNHFALMEGQILLAHLAQHFRFELTRAAAATPEALITLRPRGGLPVRVQARQPVREHAAASRSESA